MDFNGTSGLPSNFSVAPSLSDSNSMSTAWIPVILSAVLVVTALGLFVIIFLVISRCQRSRKSSDLDELTFENPVVYSYATRLPGTEKPPSLKKVVKKSSFKNSKETPPPLQYSDLPTGKDEPDEFTPTWRLPETPTTPPGAERSNSFDVVVDKGADNFMSSRRSILDSLASVGLEPQRPHSAEWSSHADLKRSGKNRKSKEKPKKPRSLKNAPTKATPDPGNTLPPHFLYAKSAKDKRNIGRYDEMDRETSRDVYKYHTDINSKSGNTPGHVSTGVTYANAI